MEVVPHRSAPTIKKLGSIRARRVGRPARARLRYAVFLARCSQPGRAEGARLVCPDHARPLPGPLPAAAPECGSPGAPAPSAEVTVPAESALSTDHLSSLVTPVLSGASSARG